MFPYIQLDIKEEGHVSEYQNIDLAPVLVLTFL